METDRKVVMGNIVVSEKKSSEKYYLKTEGSDPFESYKSCMYYASRTMHGLRGRGCNTPCFKAGHM